MVKEAKKQTVTGITFKKMGTQIYESLQQIVEHENEGYPVGVYYVEPGEMFMEHVRTHWHTETEIDLIREGSAEYRVGDKTYELHAGQAVFINRNVIHSIRSLDDSRCIIMSLIFSPAFLFPQKDSPVSQNYMLPIQNDPSFRIRIFDPKDRFGRSVISYLEDIIYANLQKEFGYELQTQSLLCQLWLLFLSTINTEDLRLAVSDEPAKNMNPDEMRIKDAIVFISRNYQDPVSLEDIADSIHVSKSECCRCFKRAVNMTPFEYLMHYRILKAAEAIQTGAEESASISDLALSVGFNNTSYFNKRFKEYFGCTPTEYRKSAKTEHRDKLSTFGLSLSHI